MRGRYEEALDLITAMDLLRELKFLGLDTAEDVKSVTYRTRRYDAITRWERGTLTGASDR
jgi:hypothetical protein